MSGLVAQCQGLVSELASLRSGPPTSDQGMTLRDERDAVLLEIVVEDERQCDALVAALAPALADEAPLALTVRIEVGSHLPNPVVDLLERNGPAHLLNLTP